MYDEDCLKEEWKMMGSIRRQWRRRKAGDWRALPARQGRVVAGHRRLCLSRSRMRRKSFCKRLFTSWWISSGRDDGDTSLLVGVIYEDLRNAVDWRLQL